MESYSKQVANIRTAALSIIQVIISNRGSIPIKREPLVITDDSGDGFTQNVEKIEADGFYTDFSDELVGWEEADVVAIAKIADYLMNNK